MTTFDIAFKSLGAVKAFEVLNSMTKSSEELRESLSDAQKEARGFTKIDNVLGGVAKKFEKLSKKAEVFKVVGGRAGIFGTEVENIGEKMVGLTGRTDGLGTALLGFGRAMGDSAREGNGFFKSAGAGFSELFTIIRTGGISATGVLASLGATLGTILFPILAIGAAVFLLKKIWDNNIGGIQTTFSKVVGKLKSLWGKFNAGFIKVLRKTLGPIIRGIIGGFTAVFVPIMDILSDIGDMISDTFGGGESHMSALVVLAEVLGGTFKILGKIIGGVFKAAWFVLKPLLKGFLLFKNLISSAIMSPLKLLWSFIQKIIGAIPDWALPDSLQKIKDSNLSDASKQNISGGGNTSNNTNNTSNNNQQITIHTSRSATAEGGESMGNSLAKVLAN